MITREYKFIAFDKQSKKLLNVIEYDFDSNYIRLEEDNGYNYEIDMDFHEIITLPYIQRKDIYGKEIYQGHILHDNSGYFDNDLIVTYDEMSDGWIDQFGCDYIWKALEKGKFEIVGHVLTMDGE